MNPDPFELIEFPEQRFKRKISLARSVLIALVTGFFWGVPLGLIIMHQQDEIRINKMNCVPLEKR